MQYRNDVLSGYVESLCTDLHENYWIDPVHFDNYTSSGV
jgi:uncharacterized lipoprotein YddW (UPF0748 family)